jgi:hypothetical protein
MAAINVLDTGGYREALDNLGNAFKQQGLNGNVSADNRSAYGTQLQHVGDQFQGLFESLVGRAPTVDEVNGFYRNEIMPNASTFSDPSYQANLTNYVANNYQGAAKDYANQQLQSQVGQAQTLADQARAQGNTAINATESSLLDYQQRLFDKLRPNLITSLSAQGLLDTGGLNQAMAGSQADLANSVQPFLAQQRLANEQNANQIAFAGASAPLAYQQSLAMNQLPYLQATGQHAADQSYNTFLTNLNFQNQAALQHNAAQNQQGLQPSFLRTLGQSFGTSLGNSAGQWFSPNPGGSSGGGSGTSGPMAMKALFA